MANYNHDFKYDPEWFEMITMKLKITPVRVCPVLSENSDDKKYPAESRKSAGDSAGGEK